jgi:hypothetical protein
MDWKFDVKNMLNLEKRNLKINELQIDELKN